MRYALAGTIRTEATPHARATCPSCAGPVLAKCGPIVRWHWAHIGQDDCDPWAEEPSPWHRQWQEFVPPAWREVTLGPHRADILASDGTVVELQHSHLPADQIAARETFYPKMIWIFDVGQAYRAGRLDLRRRDGYMTFRWKHPRKSIALCRRPVLLDLGDTRLLHLRRIHTAAPCGGWGNLLGLGDVISWMYRCAHQAAAA